MSCRFVVFFKLIIFRLNRLLNNRHRYAFPSENNGWIKYSKNPVYGNRETGSIFDPSVSLVNNRFVMIVSERKNHCIISLQSENGYDWGDRNIILSPILGTWQTYVNRATLVFHENLWHMWYTGQSPQISCIGHCISYDGSHFENAKAPCLKAELGQEGMSVMNPCVLWNDKKKKFQMWYAAGDNYEPDVLFYAESYNGDNWEKNEDPILSKLPTHEWEKYKIGGCDIKLLPDGTYVMYYIGYQNVDVARICYAISKDGINWERKDNNLLIAPSKNTFDSDAVYKPSVAEKDGKLYLWYNGRCKNEEYIGLANKTIII